jgi:MSHA type pilus biogenesis protein MshL
MLSIKRTKAFFVPACWAAFAAALWADSPALSPVVPLPSVQSDSGSSPASSSLKPSAQAPLLPSYRLGGQMPIAHLKSLDAVISVMPPSDPLEKPVHLYRVTKLPIEAAFESVSRSYGVTVVFDPGLKGEVTLELQDGTVRDLLDALTQSQGYYWEREGRLIAVRRNVVRFYQIDYPQMTRSAQGTSNVVLTAQSNNYANGNPYNGTVTGTQTVLSNVANSGSNNGSNGANQNDETNISIEQKNQTTFWADVQTELSGLAETGEAVTINKLAGLAIVTAPPRRQTDFQALIAELNRRITQQVRITAKVLEVDLNSQAQLGVDWSLAATKVGGIALSGFSTATAFSSINGLNTIPSTVSGTVSTGKIAAVISALQEQGTVHSVSNPSVLSLNNQTAFVKVGTEQTFFSVSNITTINQTTTTTPYSTIQNSYQQNPITIGTVLYVTPEVNSDGSVTVDVLPAITELIGVDTSPDNQQTAPRMTIKSLSTIARLHPGESVMIGGLIYESTSTQTQKVPLLGDLPVVGKAFQTNGTIKSRSELVIFLTAERVQ